MKIILILITLIIALEKGLVNLYDLTRYINGFSSNKKGDLYFIVTTQLTFQILYLLGKDIESLHFYEMYYNIGERI